VLMIAAYEGSAECVSILLANGADVNFATLKVIGSKCCAILLRELTTSSLRSKEGRNGFDDSCG
jgi:ankyrin repeat protein